MCVGFVYYFYSSFTLLRTEFFDFTYTGKNGNKAKEHRRDESDKDRSEKFDSFTAVMARELI